MFCRKKIYTHYGSHRRCETLVDTPDTNGYCQGHWFEYQLGEIPYISEQDYEFSIEEYQELLYNLDSFSRHNISFQNERTQAEQTILAYDDMQLERFASDSENVHTTQIVQTVQEVAKEMISLAQSNPTDDVLVSVLQIPSLSYNARKNLCDAYYLDGSIYELPTPTYRLVLEGVWIYIQKQDRNLRRELIHRLEQELEDNVGTCLAGNVSRLINIFHGFGKMIQEPESLQIAMSKIAKESNKQIRIAKAKELLSQRRIPREHHNDWLEALESY